MTGSLKLQKKTYIVKTFNNSVKLQTILVIFFLYIIPLSKQTKKDAQENGDMVLLKNNIK